MEPDEIVQHIIDALPVQGGQTAPSEWLWHYTTIGGLQGIIKDGGLRATDVQFMNDSSELIYARAVIVEAWSAFVGDVNDEELNGFSEAMQQWLGTVFEVPTFITCFCAKPDLLSQWRGYSHGQIGYSLGFDLGAFVERPTVRTPTGDWLVIPLIQVVYDRDEQRAVMSRFFHAWWTACRDLITKGEATEEQLFPRIDGRDIVATPRLAMAALGGTLAPFYLTFKHQAFSEEQEWRLVLPVSYQAERRRRELAAKRARHERAAAAMSAQTGRNIGIPPDPPVPGALGFDFGFHESAMGLRPFVTVPLSRDGRLPLKGVRQGPQAAHPDLARDSMKGFLGWNGYSVPVETSDIPLRIV